MKVMIVPVAVRNWTIAATEVRSPINEDRNVPVDILFLKSVEVGLMLDSIDFPKVVPTGAR